MLVAIKSSSLLGTFIWMDSSFFRRVFITVCILMLGYTSRSG